MFGDHRFDDFRDVFNDPCSRSFAVLQFATAFRATVETVRLALVDLGWAFPASPFVSVSGAGFLAVFGLVGLRVDWHHARRG